MMDAFRKAIDEIFEEISTVKSILDAGINPSSTTRARLTLEIRLARIQTQLNAAVLAMPLEARVCGHSKGVCEICSIERWMA